MMEQYLVKVKQELRLRNYSRKTEKAYLGALRKYFAWMEEQRLSERRKNGGNIRGNRRNENQYYLPVEYPNEAAIRAFLVGEQERKLSAQSINLYLAAIKFLYAEVLGVRWVVRIKWAKVGRSLPVVLTRAEVVIILRNIGNLKHRLMVGLAYGAGLRVSEVCSLKVRDLDFGNHFVHIRAGKGGKDRVTLLPRKLEAHLAVFCRGKMGGDYVFESERGGRLSTRSLQNVFMAARERAGVVKSATFHSLRHSFATHLLQNGTDIRYIQELMGHAQLRTTQMYTQVAVGDIAKIQSPL